MKKFLFLTVLSVFFAALVFTQPASATMTLSVSDGTNTVSIVDNGAGDFSPTTGVMGYSGTLGSNWFLTGAQSFQGADSYMHLSDMSITSTTGGTLHITLTDTFVYNANTIPMASIMGRRGQLGHSRQHHGNGQHQWAFPWLARLQVPSVGLFRPGRHASPGIACGRASVYGHARSVSDPHRGRYEQLRSFGNAHPRT